jgi:transcriptional regulator with XRE-family HTH domain
MFQKARYGKEKTMQLTQPEIILILRKRANITQAELGSKAFETSPNSGRTKIKNIELGRQLATDNDLKRIAQCLDVPLEMFEPTPEHNDITADYGEVGFLISQKVVDMFMNLRKYLEMLNEAADLGDSELIAYLAKKIASILEIGPDADASVRKQNAM